MWHEKWSFAFPPEILHQIRSLFCRFCSFRKICRCCSFCRFCRIRKLCRIFKLCRNCKLCRLEFVLKIVIGFYMCTYIQSKCQTGLKTDAKESVNRPGERMHRVICWLVTIVARKGHSTIIQMKRSPKVIILFVFSLS